MNETEGAKPQSPREIAKAELAKYQSAGQEVSDAGSIGETETADEGGIEGPGGEEEVRDQPEGGAGVREPGPGREVAGEQEAKPEAEGEEGEGEEEVEGLQRAVIKTLPRRVGDPVGEIEIEGLTPEQVEDVRRSNNGVMRRAVYEEEMHKVQQARAEIREMVTELQLDPVGYILNNVDEQHLVPLALSILSNYTEVYEPVVTELARWEDDPNLREAAVAKLKLEAMQRAAKAQEARAERARIEQNYGAVMAEIRAQIRDDLSDDDYREALDAAMMTIQGFADANRMQFLDPALVGPILKRRVILRPFLRTQDTGKRTTTAEPSSAARSLLGDQADTSLQVEAAGPALAAGSARRRAVTTSAPPGGGPAPVAHKIPDDIKAPTERAAWLLRRMRRSG